MASADTPKYTDLMNWIREQILSGEFTIGMRLPSENELGKKFSISRQTVRQATSVLESEGLLERRRGSGTYVSATSNSVKKSSSRNIGVVLTYLDDYIFPSIVKGIERVLTKNGYFMQLAFTYNRVEKEAYILDSMIKNNIDGLIIEPSKSGIPYINTDFYQKIKALGIPCIFVHADTNPLMGIPSIRMDDYLLGQSAAEYLIKHGHKNIAGIFKSDDMQGQLRYSGVINALKHHDLLASERNMYWYTTEDIKLIRNGNLDTEILDRIGNATALVCYNDEMAKTLIDILYKSDKKIPDDISIISFDDLALESTIGLTTFAHPKQELGKIVAVQLLKLLDNPNFNASIKFPPKLIERDSVKTI
ncbi:MAG TPA: GntR family transcriptional regulator [Megamonas hypermegale]|uniref:GntR family transcriptional regulator n=1 Tax=Megamonas hypermegale TaxID=158847 RepID=A0A921L825_9FIRM|nr:GntR family transcriptional regulator [Megamonas hypermegale]HJF85454.1 GntR family transcriptional regulator [Megamonas hypermegale]